MDELDLYEKNNTSQEVKTVIDTMESDSFRQFKKRIIEQRNEIMGLKKEREGFCSDKETLLSKSKSYSNEINELNQQIEDNSDLCGHLNQTINEKDTEINSLKGENDKLRKNLNNMGTPDEQDEIIECLTKQLKKYKQIIRDIKD